MNIYYWLHSYSPYPIALQIGNLTIYWYGVMLALAIIFALLVFLYLGLRNNLSVDNILDASTWLIIGGIIGARLYDVILELPYYINHPTSIYKIWQGGLAIHGGIIGGLIVLLVFSKLKKINIWKIIGALVPGLALGQAIGRWGNWFNQELFGRPTNLSWGIPINLFKRPVGYESYDYFQPTFLYESILLLVVSCWLFVLVKNKKVNDKLILAFYLISYGLIRFILELIKIDSTPSIFNLRWPQIVSLIMIMAGVCLVFLKNKKAVI
ncbi:MAG: prolipoprotein diacylglyceryl transferase [Candidatus Falkowbacteria bacterium]|nr:prolipoprotein diacylglyceryl transferase [Candidatus Falkowbacteria bacterium]